MHHYHSSFGRRPSRRACAMAALTSGLLALQVSGAAAQNTPVPAEFQGTWVPAKATCESPARFEVAADRLTLINGKDSQSFGDVHLAGPSYWGPDYQGIMAVAISEFNGDQPVTAMFNYDEKKGAALVDFSQVSPGAANNATLAAYNAKVTKLNLAKRFPLNKVLLKKCPAGSGAGAGAVPARQATARPAAPAGPSVCAGKPHCVEVTPFAATVTDFRTSTSGGTKVVTVTMRFQNRTSAPLILGYVQGSGIVTDDRGNRYTVHGQGAVRGIGEISNSTFDPKFTLQPGEASDARVEFQWTPQRGQIFGTTYDIELAVRQIEELEGNQFQLGKEHALKLAGFTAGTSVAPAQPGGAAVPAAGAGNAPAASGAAIPAAPADAPDPCAGKARCYSAGPFGAEITQVTTSKVSYYVYMHLNVKVRNVTAQPLVLGWQSGSGVAIDDAGNRYAATSVKGIGLVSSGSADPQFALNPGQSRAFTIDYVVRPGRAVVGTSWTADFVLEQLEILPSRQVRSVREYSVSYQDLTAGKSSASAPAAGAASGGSTTGVAAAGDTAAGDTAAASDAASAVNATAGAVKAVGKLFKSK